MTRRFCLALLASLLLQPLTLAQQAGSKVTINRDLVLEVNGRPVLPIGFTMPPPPDGKAPDGKHAYEELSSAGATFMRTGPGGSKGWDDEWIETEKRYQDAAAKYGMFCLPWLKELSAVESKHPENEARLRKVINLFKDHPGMGCWKGEDEPEWGKKPVEPMLKAYQIIKELDPNHPVWIVEAPRGTIDSLRPYMPTRDITGIDIYPLSYPPGIHSLLPNKELSMVGDYTQFMRTVAQDKKPTWMTLQIAWSGVVREERTLRMPTYFEERFMAYQAVINGARGLIFFGGNLQQAMNDEDKKLGWNWTFWRNVLRPVIEQLGDKSPLKPALIAPESALKINAKYSGVSYTSADQIEFTVREAGSDIYVLACNRGHDTVQISFEGFPQLQTTAEVMFEAPRTVQTKWISREVEKPKKGTTQLGVFTDWFAPFEVHVYKLKRK